MDLIHNVLNIILNLEEIGTMKLFETEGRKCTTALKFSTLMPVNVITR